MSKIVILRISKGSFEEGFDVTLEIRENGRILGSEAFGKLIPNPAILQTYQKWQETYHSWGKARGWWNQNHRVINVPSLAGESVSIEFDEVQVQIYENKFIVQFTEWLSSSSLQKIREELLQNVQRSEPVRFFVKTENTNLQKFPWERWDILRERFNSPEVALNIKSFSQKEPLQTPVKILVVLGSDENINIKTDLRIIENKLSKLQRQQILENIHELSSQELKIIVQEEPSPWEKVQDDLSKSQQITYKLLDKPSSEELRTTLNIQAWDIIFFSGHSFTHTDENDGIICINKNEYLSLDKLYISLQHAAQKGLKLAIFNSCDGLGLARKLTQLEIPHIIVMRQPIRDEAAHDFLENFLTSFTQGKSLHQSVREARERLLLLENASPSASLLPVIIQNTEESPFNFPQEPIVEPRLSEPKPTLLEQIKKQLWNNKIIRFVLLFILSLLIFLLIISPPPAITVCPTNSNLLSCGEKDDFIDYPIQTSSLSQEKDGRRYFTNGNYKAAVQSFENAWKQEKDPSTLIALNNAKILRDFKTNWLNKNDVFPIAIFVSYKNLREFISESALSGIAWQQNEFNTQNSKKLLVIMADDYHNKERGQDIAIELGKMQDILGVLGPYSSHVTYYIIENCRKAGLSIVSPTSTASKSNYPNPNLDTSYFFRTATTTKFSSKKLVEYLTYKGYKKVFIFFNDRELFGRSFYLDFQESLKDSNIKKLGEKSFIDIDESELIALIDNLKKQDTTIKETTALVLLPGAYTTTQDHAKKLQIIRANKGEFFIAGSNTVYDREVLDLLYDIGEKAIENMVVTVPWFPSDDEVRKIQDVFGKNPGLTWHTFMAYDSTKVLGQAIINELEQGRKPTRKGIRDALANLNFEAEGLTGKITFNGSDRKEQFTVLIHPVCSANSCTWQPIEKYSNQ